MTTLKLFVNALINKEQSSITRQAYELTKALAENAPTNCSVEALVPRISPDAYNSVRAKLPEEVLIKQLALPPAALEIAWGKGAFWDRDALIHTPGLVAPYIKHNRLYDNGQLSVSIHDTLSWEFPQSVSKKRNSQNKKLLKKAYTHADALIVPTHTISDLISGYYNFGDRIRVVNPACATTLTVQDDAQQRAERLKLPKRFVLTMGSLDPHTGVIDVIYALKHVPDVDLVIVGPLSQKGPSAQGIAAQAGLSEDRVHQIGFLNDADLAVIYSLAKIFIFPTLGNSSILPLIEALSFGLPCLYTSTSSAREVIDDAGIRLTRTMTNSNSYQSDLADALREVLQNKKERERLKILARDRARLFSWKDAASMLWQIHADL